MGPKVPDAVLASALWIDGLNAVRRAPVGVERHKLRRRARGTATDVKSAWVTCYVSAISKKRGGLFAQQDPAANIARHRGTTSKSHR